MTVQFQLGDHGVCTSDQGGRTAFHRDLGDDFDRFGTGRKHRTFLASEVTTGSSSDDSRTRWILAEQRPGEGELALCLEGPQTAGTVRRCGCLEGMDGISCPSSRCESLGPVLFAHCSGYGREWCEHLTSGVHGPQRADQIARQELREAEIVLGLGPLNVQPRPAELPVGLREICDGSLRMTTTKVEAATIQQCAPGFLGLIGEQRNGR